VMKVVLPYKIRRCRADALSGHDVPRLAQLSRSSEAPQRQRAATRSCLSSEGHRMRAGFDLAKAIRLATGHSCEQLPPQ